MHPEVTLERYAEARAEMEAGRLRDEVLVRIGLTIEEWTSAQREWLEKMGAELERGRFELTNRYTQAFLERQRALASAVTPPPIEAPAAQVEIVPHLPARPASVTEQPAPAAEVVRPPSMLAVMQPVDPPLMLAPSMPSALVPNAMRGLTNVEATQDAPLVPMAGPALPFDPTAPPQLPAVAAAPALTPTAMRGFVDVQATQDVSLAAAAEPATPFEPVSPSASAQSSRQNTPQANALPAPPSPGAPPASIPKAMQGFTDLEGTRFALPEAAAEPVLPFDPMASPQLRALEMTTVWVPKGMQGMADVATTQLAPGSPLGPALPFESPVAALDQTSAIPAHPRAAPAPSAAAPAPSGPKLALEQHASLRVELDLHPQHRTEILRRYFISETQLAELDAAYGTQFASDPKRRAAWYAAYAAYRTWLLASSGKGRT